MMSNLKHLFGPYIKNLEQECEELKKEVNEIKMKLVEKQEHINTTNKYYKKKLKELTKP
jgi:peptidoglycan hydrolase CwlO-like protein